MKHIGFDSDHCGCVLRRTSSFPCTCELVGVMPLTEVHVMWTRLSFSNMSCSESSSKLSIQQEFDVILNCFKQVDIVGKVTIKSKLSEIAYPDMTSMCSPVDIVKTKGSHKCKTNRLAQSTKRDPSYLSMLTRFIPCMIIILH